MGRARAVLQAEFPYNISVRCINREWFTIPMDDVWEIFCNELKSVHEKQNLQIYSFVLMSNHYHLIASTPDANISSCMHQFNTRSSLRLSRAGNRINESFAGRHHKTILQTNSYFLNAYKYNFRNPVKAGICLNVEDYPYSSLQFSIGAAKPLFPLVYDPELSLNKVRTLEWFNEAPHPDKVAALQQGMRRQYFESPRDRSMRKPIIGVDELI